MWKMFNDYGYTEDVISLYICIDMFNNVPFCYSLFIYLNNSITIHYCFSFIFQINISFFILPRSRTVNHWIYRLSPLIQKKTLVWHRYNNANNGGVFFKTCRLYYNKLAHGELVRPLSMLKCFNIYRLNYKQSFVCSSIPASLKLSIHLKKNPNIFWSTCTLNLLDLCTASDEFLLLSFVLSTNYGMHYYLSLKINSWHYLGTHICRFTLFYAKFF